MKIIIVILLAALSSCAIIPQPTMYEYTYRDVGKDSLLTGRDRVMYLPGDTVVFIPSGRQIVIETLTVDRTTLKRIKH